MIQYLWNLGQKMVFQCDCSVIICIFIYSEISEFNHVYCTNENNRISTRIRLPELQTFKSHIILSEWLAESPIISESFPQTENYCFGLTFGLIKTRTECFAINPKICRADFCYFPVCQRQIWCMMESISVQFRGTHDAWLKCQLKLYSRRNT